MLRIVTQAIRKLIALAMAALHKPLKLLAVGCTPLGFHSMTPKDHAAGNELTTRTFLTAVR